MGPTEQTYMITELLYQDAAQKNQIRGVHGAECIGRGPSPHSHQPSTSKPTDPEAL